MRELIPARLELTTDGTPYSSLYDDVYHSRSGGLAQLADVFLAGNHLPQAWASRARYILLETGFGQGLNFLGTWQAWRADDKRCAQLHFVSVEQHPFSRNDLIQLHQHYPELAGLAQQLHEQWPVLTPGMHTLEFEQGRVRLTLMFGAAEQELARLQLQADAIFLDGFSPDKNPQLWCAPIYQQLRRLSHSATTLASYTVAGHVRRGLKDAGFDVERVAGFGSKRQRLAGRASISPRHPPTAPFSPPARTIHIIGAGLAGCATAWQLARRGWQVTLIDAAATIATQSSGNDAGLMHPTFSKDDNLLSRLSRAGCAHTLRVLRELGVRHSSLRWGQCGQLQLAKNAAQAALMEEIARHLPAELCQWLDQTAASVHCQHEVASGGWWFPQACWINPPSLCAALLADQPGIRFIGNTRIEQVSPTENGWLLRTSDNEQIRAEQLVLANAAAANALLDDAGLPLGNEQRLVCRIHNSALAQPAFSVSGPAYLTPAVDGLRVLGASPLPEGADPQAVALQTLNDISKLLPKVTLDAAAMHDWRSCYRPGTPDRLPLVGAIPRALHEQSKAHQLWQIARQPGLHAVLGLGARGLSWCLLAGDILAAQLDGDVMPVEADLLHAVDPARFLLRQLRKGG